MKYNKLTPEEENVIVHKGTERPFTGKYVNYKENGNYTCKRCGAILFSSKDKFESDCGWPSFDDEVPGAVTHKPDMDGIRTEILCSACGAHLGHVFKGENLTKKNTRYCVNSISMNFIPAVKKVNNDTVYFAGGCFWGTEYHFRKVAGVISTSVGFTGGHKEDPTYLDVCTGTTGHAEVVQVVYDPEQVGFEKLAKLFFEIHDFTQTDGQGPDIGEQYRSGIFYTKNEQKLISQQLIDILVHKGFKVVTELTPAGKYWIAEDYHQDYYEKKGSKPYCHIYRKIF